MATSETSTSIYLLPGMSAKFSVPRFYVGHGDRKILNDLGEYTKHTLTNGFTVLYPDVGDIEPVPEEPAVIYTHKKFGLNKIYFFTRTGEIGVVDVIAVPIHDHSSIIAGGPAYGTYFTDDETVVSPTPTEGEE